MSVADAEQAVVGSIIKDPTVLRKVQAEVMPSDFHDQRLGAIYAGVMHMATTREPIDYLTVFGHLSEWDVRGIGLGQLSGWVDGIPTASNADYYAVQVRQAALGRGLKAIAGRVLDSADSVPAEQLISRVADELRDLREHHIVENVHAMALDEVLTQEVQYDWVIPDLLERKDRFMITGVEGGGKSTLIRQLAITAAAGIHPFREYPVDPVRVLVVDAENTEKQWGRETRRWAPSMNMLEGQDVYKRLHLACLRRMDLTKDIDLGMVHRLVDQYRPDMLFIGPMYRLAPKLNNDEDAAPLLAALDTLRDRGLALVIEAHAGHQTNPRGERDLRPRGSSQLMGWPEFGYGLRASKNPLHVEMVRWRGDRDARGWPAKLGRAAPGVTGTQRWPWRPVD